MNFRKKIVVLIVMVFTGSFQITQPMGAARQLGKRFGQLSVPVRAVIAGTATYGTVSGIFSLLDEYRFKEALRLEKDFNPVWLTPEYRQEIEKRFSKFRQCTRLVINDALNGSCSCRSFKDGRCILKLQRTFGDDFDKEYTIAHEAAHHEGDHSGARLSMMKNVAAVAVSALATGRRAGHIAGVSILYGYIAAASGFSHIAHEKEADIKNKTPEELWLGFCYAEGGFFSPVVPLKEGMRAKVIRKYHEIMTKHPLRDERRLYFYQQMKEQIENSGLNDIPVTEGELRKALRVYFHEDTEVDAFLMGKKEFRPRYEVQEIFDLIKKRITFLQEQYKKCYPESIAALKVALKTKDDSGWWSLFASYFEK